MYMHIHLHFFNKYTILHKHMYINTYMYICISIARPDVPNIHSTQLSNLGYKLTPFRSPIGSISEFSTHIHNLSKCFCDPRIVGKFAKNNILQDH